MVIEGKILSNIFVIWEDCTRCGDSIKVSLDCMVEGLKIWLTLFFFLCRLYLSLHEVSFHNFRP